MTSKVAKGAHRRLAALGMVAAGVVLTTQVAFAGNAQLQGTPSCSGSASAGVTCSGKVTGVGSIVTNVFLSADTVSVTYVCQNHGLTAVPAVGTWVTPNVTGQGQAYAPRNGAIKFTVTINPPAAPTPSQAGCPNAKTWNLVPTSTVYSNLSLHAQQAGADLSNFPVSLGSFNF